MLLFAYMLAYMKYFLYLCALFVENYENVPFIEAVSIVADKCGMELSKDVLTNTKVDNFKEEHEIMELSQKFFQNNLKTTAGVEANKYLAER